MPSPSDITYSDKYQDNYYEYRHVELPQRIAKPRRLLSDTEWRALGINQSRGWEHYMLWEREPHILCFRRPLGTDPATGKPPADWKPPPTTAVASAAAGASPAVAGGAGAGAAVAGACTLWQ